MLLIRAAENAEVQVSWNLCHSGGPDDLAAKSFHTASAVLNALC